MPEGRGVICGPECAQRTCSSLTLGVWDERFWGSFFALDILPSADAGIGVPLFYHARKN